MSRVTNPSALRPRVPFAALSPEGRLAALRLWQPDYFTGSSDREYSGLSLANWQALVMAFWIQNPERSFMDDNSGRM